MGGDFDAVAAVVIGGALLTGGSEFVAGTFLGIVIMGLIQTYLVFDEALSRWWTKIVISGQLCAFIVSPKRLSWAMTARRKPATVFAARS